MANAAAKKAAAARSAAKSTYLPLMLGMNAVYVLLRLRRLDEALSFWHVIGTLVLWILEYMSYQGILESAAAGGSKKSNGAPIAGGVYLDLLGLTVLVQFGTCLWTANFYWLLSIVPPVAAYKVYTAFKNSMPGGGKSGPQRSEPPTGQIGESEELAEKRRKRAERRRQKRA